MMYLVNNKAARLFLILGSFFLANALIAEFIGVKIFSLERTFGFQPLQWSLFGQEGLSFNLTTGVLLWPVVFIMTDIINEYFGRKGVRLLSYLAAGMILYAFLMFSFGIRLPPADFWPTSHIQPDWPIEQQDLMRSEVGNYNAAFRLVFGQGLWIIVGSLIAFLLGQLIDVFTFHWIKEQTGEKWIWLRATGSTLISQFIDSFVVLFVAFYIGAGWDFRLVLAIGVVNYIYKFAAAVAMTPLLYLAHDVIDGFLGKELAEELKNTAMQKG
ncbi:MAG: queuosine precursor transporter [Saprospiraceae bacterium]|nr:queuosine precursor transporter [Saprospiraceae bacterium]MCB9311495.1 queuosine precursor transporter [Lewinellaceae bacterium]HRW76041.1 queuosine precursor transporter [Saprospiraceae bacterium]